MEKQQIPNSEIAVGAFHRLTIYCTDWSESGTASKHSDSHYRVHHSSITLIFEQFVNELMSLWYYMLFLD